MQLLVDLSTLAPARPRLEENRSDTGKYASCVPEPGGAEARPARPWRIDIRSRRRHKKSFKKTCRYEAKDWLS
jgi:hypothetical protein